MKTERFKSELTELVRTPHLEKIIELVEEAQDSKSEAERFIDRFSKYYTPAVLVLAIVVWAFSQNIELAITILVLGCPGALVIGCLSQTLPVSGMVLVTVFF